MEMDTKEVNNRISDVYIFLKKMGKRNKMGDKREFFYAVDLFYHLLFWKFNDKSDSSLNFKEISKNDILQGLDIYFKKINKLNRCRKEDLGVKQ